MLTKKLQMLSLSTIFNGVKVHYGDPLWALLGLMLYYIQYNCSKNMVHLILGINFGFWALQQLFLQN
jgi:hypothetical protein